ncbi:MAG: hypothetical protein OXH52_04110 [Gammaproteobacteria bacterium]|nr:hypothetical protein [Gammaproteobacteria bacterium]
MRHFLLLVVLVFVAHRPALGQPAARDAGGLTAYRPQHGMGYLPFARTAVREEFEEHPRLGPGIRVNRADEVDFDGEDDLIEIVITRPSPETTLVLERSHSSLAIWETRDKRAQTGLAFIDDRSVLPDFGQASRRRLWVEWTGAAPEFPVLSLRAQESDVIIDRIVFHAFTSLVVALGGKNHVPNWPLHPDHGTYRMATGLYEAGYDVFMRRESEVRSDGAGLVYEEVVNAVRNRAVHELAIVGYSHGAGSTYNLCARLNDRRAHIGTFSISFTSYVDGIRNAGPLDGRAERRRPPTTVFHVNQYQLRDWLLRGAPVADSTPPPSGLRVETRLWGREANHINIDDLQQVRNFIHTQLTAHVNR